MAGSARRSFHRLFIANRGEVAVRVARSCQALGIVPVFGVSEADRDAPWTDGHEQVVLGPARSTLSYLDPVRVVQAARQSRCTALHPGWGFLSENPTFAALCEQHGITFLGPPAHVMHLMGKKTPAKKVMGAAGLTLIPGSDGILADLPQAREVAAQVGYPVLLKAESGGGGRGMRIARAPDQLDQAWNEASAEALAAFGDGRLYLEKLIEGGRHIEIQIMADRYGNVVHLGERDCTVQRNHQKLIEESPAPTLDPDERARTLAAAVAATRQIGYVGAGTIEFLLDQSSTPAVLRFMEMNTRLQVEHCVSEQRSFLSEQRSNVDLVREQIRVAAGSPLSFTQDQIELRGHAIECRINAEDPHHDFRPAPGTITRWVSPPDDGGHIRVDTHVRSGYTVPPFYDSLLCKVIAWGEDREVACERMIQALEQLVCEGVPTTAPMHLEILASEAFRSHRYDTRAIPGFPTR
jgi:acetyl-CoA carboxylase biotin carboxylase subunit